jgi:hypothetical protein
VFIKAFTCPHRVSHIARPVKEIIAREINVFVPYSSDFATETVQQNFKNGGFIVKQLILYTLLRIYI